MNIYLAIITTVLVLTQIIRVTQNAISLYRQEKELAKKIGWLKDYYVTERDFEVQREVFYMLHDKLEQPTIIPSDVPDTNVGNIKGGKS